MPSTDTDIVKPSQHKKVLLLVMSGVLLVLIVGGSLTAYRLHGTDKAPAEATKAAAEKATFKKVTDQATAAKKDKDYTKAVNAYQEYIKTNPSPDRKYEAQLDIGAIYFSQSDYKNALAAFKSAESLDTGTAHPEYSPIAISYEQLGQYANAITYYQKLIDGYPKGQTGASIYVQHWQDKITELKGKVSS